MSALLALAIDLAPSAPELTRWGRDHAALITAQAEPVIQTIRTRYADRLAALKERQ